MKYAYNGALHIHTTFSDGSSSIENVIKYAKKAGLKWIIITDHNNLDGLSYEGWHNGVLVLVGEEISPATENHYLALDVKEIISPDLPPEAFIQEVKKQGGIGFVAHPDEKHGRKNSHKPLRWSDWSITGFDGIEIWNYLSDWVDNFDDKKQIQHYISRNDILKGPSKQTLKWWDELNNNSEAIVPAVGGVDAHALVYKVLGFDVKVFPYIDTFKTLTNRIYTDEKLSENFEVAKKQVLNALKSGKNLIFNRCWDKSNDPIFYLKDKDKKYYAGDTVEYSENCVIIAKFPYKAQIRLIYDGQLIWECVREEFIFEHLDRGKYRIEAYLGDKPYVFSNPINII